MSYLRCTHCGAKALSAASQCPRCTRPFDLHDARGMRVALRACRGCGYMHRIDRACVTCGETAPRVKLDVAWTRRAAAAALGLTVVGAVWRFAPLALTGAPATANAGPVVTPRAAAAAMTAPVALPPAVAMVAAVAPAEVPSAPSSPASGPLVGPNATPMADDARPLQRAAAPGAPAGDSIAWIPAVARTWVNVRSDASRGGDVVGVIKPSSRAMLGSNRAGWRQVRSPDAVGWVDPRLFEPDSTRPRGE